MSQVLVNFRMEKEDKIGMEEVCSIQKPILII